MEFNVVKFDKGVRMEVGKCVIRPIGIEDAGKWITLLKKLLSETDAMLYTDNDRDFNVERCRQHIMKMRKLNKSEILVLEAPTKEIVGYLLGEIENMKKKSHVMTIRGGVLKRYQAGYGRKMANKMIEIARLRGIRKIELSVLEKNTICINTCKKSGFEQEGLKRCSVRINDSYENECTFGMLL